MKIAAIGIFGMFIGIAMAGSGKPIPLPHVYSEYMWLHTIIFMGIPMLWAYLAGRYDR